MSITTAPTLDELRAAASGECSSATLAHLIGRTKKDESEPSGADADVIVVKRHPNRKRSAVRKDEFAQQYHRNCFYQFRDLCDTKQSFFGIKDDEEPAPAEPEVAE